MWHIVKVPRSDNTYLEAIDNALQTIRRLLGSKFEDFFRLLGRDLTAHDLPRRNIAKFDGDERSRTNLRTNT